MLTKRIVACLDVKDGKVVKGTQFRGHEVVGEILDLSRRYRDEGVDELVFYDIEASADGRRVSRKWVEDVARVIDVPFCVAGGIRTLQDAREVLNSGADKISINSPALENPALISELARVFGNQCVVVGVDSKRQDGDYFVYCYTGSETKTRLAGRKTMDWIVEAQRLGAGEIVLNCMNQDGTGVGYDIEQLKQARALLSIPLVASGGARNADHFENVFKHAGVDAALAAGAFHRGELKIPSLKKELALRGIEIRL
jgi:cyclase